MALIFSFYWSIVYTRFFLLLWTPENIESIFYRIHFIWIRDNYRLILIIDNFFTFVFKVFLAQAEVYPGYFKVENIEHIQKLQEINVKLCILINLICIIIYVNHHNVCGKEHESHKFKNQEILLTKEPLKMCAFPHKVAKN